MSPGEARRAVREHAHGIRVIVTRATIGPLDRMHLREVASMLDAGELDSRILREHANTLRSISTRRTVRLSDGEDILSVAALVNELALELGKRSTNGKAQR